MGRLGVFGGFLHYLVSGRALAAETHEGWLEATRYLNMEHLKERKKEALRAIAA